MAFPVTQTMSAQAGSRVKGSKNSFGEQISTLMGMWLMGL